MPPLDVTGNGPKRTIRVILADDNSIVRMGLLRALRSAKDIEVVAEAADGLAAVETACCIQPDLVLMDVSMPGIDGLEATRRIRTACPQVPVIGLTMYTDVKDRMLEAGAVACLDKGTPVAVLVAAIREHAAMGGEDAPAPHGQP